MVDNEAELKVEAERLGPHARERITAVQNFVTAQVGHDLAPKIIQDLTKAQHIEGFEKLMASFRNQRSQQQSELPRSPQPPRELPNGPSKVDEATFSKMSARERLDYVRQFPQAT